MLKAVVILGTTASGKSDLGVALARRLRGEIISADSRQVYRGFDLCSGKLPVSQRRGVPHHLMDIRDVGERFSAADFQAETYALIPQITVRGALPIIVGGTGLYIDSVTRGYDFSGGPPDEALRAELGQLSDDELAAEIARLRVPHPPAGEMYSLNRRRMIRLLESARSGRHVGYGASPRFDILSLGLTWPRDLLARRIKQRLDERLNAGMVGEVETYLNSGGDSGVMLGLGLEFRHICMYLTGGHPSLREMSEKLETDIRRFAKRQTTWFRRDASIVWLDPSGDLSAQAAEKIHAFMLR